MMKKKNEILEKLQNEVKELDIKIDQLRKFIKTIDYQKSINTEQRRLLKMQYYSMIDCSLILLHRIDDLK